MTRVIAWGAGFATVFLAAGGVALTLQKLSQVKKIKLATKDKNAEIKE